MAWGHEDTLHVTHLHVGSHSPKPTDESQDEKDVVVGSKGGAQTEHSVDGQRHEEGKPPSGEVGERPPEVAAEEHPEEDDGAQQRVLPVGNVGIRPFLL